MTSVNKVILAIKKLDRATFNKHKQRLLRQWVEDREMINVLNYWYYRYFTRSFENYVVRKYINKEV